MSNGKTLCEVFAEEEKTEAAKRKNECREQVVEAVRRLGKVSAVAKELGITGAAVYSALVQAGVSVLDITREHRAVRNRELAEYAAEHGTPAACKAFCVSSRTVRSACEEAGVHPAFPRLPVAGSSLRIAGLLLKGLDVCEVARELGVTKQRVSKVRQECQTYGIVTSPIRPAKNSDGKS